jgi:hypothetical protein
MVITGSSVAARCWRRPLAWPRTPAVFGPLACRPSARAGPPGRRRPPAQRAKPERAGHDAGRVAPRAQGPPRPPRNRIVPSVRGRAGCPGAGVATAWWGAAQTLWVYARASFHWIFQRFLIFSRTWILTLGLALFMLRRWRVARDGQLTLGYGGPAVRKLAWLGFLLRRLNLGIDAGQRSGGSKNSGSWREIGGRECDRVAGAKGSSLRSSGRIIG